MKIENRIDFHLD